MCYIKPFNEFPNASSFCFFEGDIKPMWEDSRNLNGGRYIIRIQKGYSDQVFNELIVATVGEQFIEDMVGMTINFKYNEDIIAIWHKNSHNNEYRSSI
jgi:translation initiation factor 4E